MFKSESELLATLDQYDRLLIAFAGGESDLTQFWESYDSFYMAYALDGHESDDEDKGWLAVHGDRLQPHREVWEKIVAGGLTLTEGDELPNLHESARFGQLEVRERLKLIVAKYFE